MIIDKDKLRQALEVVKPGLASKEIIEQTTSFAFLDGKVITYNDEICLSHPLEELDINGVIKAEELYKFLNKTKQKEIELTQTEDQIILKAGRSQAGFALTTELHLPLEEEISTKKQWHELPEKFIEALNFTIPCVSQDITNPKLTCIHLNQKGSVESCDNFRIAFFQFDTELPVKSALLPGKSAKEVIKIKPTHITDDNGWLHFKNEAGTELSCRIFHEDYIDTKGVINKKHDFINFTFPEETKEILEKAQIFAQASVKDINQEHVEVSVKKKTLLIESQSETAWFKERIRVKDYTGEDFVFAVTPYLLKEILDTTNSCEVSESVLKFSSSNWIYISALRKLK